MLGSREIRVVPKVAWIKYLGVSLSLFFECAETLKYNSE